VPLPTCPPTPITETRKGISPKILMALGFSMISFLSNESNRIGRRWAMVNSDNFSVISLWSEILGTKHKIVG
jgi:hypothetical protein